MNQNIKTFIASNFSAFSLATPEPQNYVVLKTVWDGKYPAGGRPSCLLPSLEMRFYA